MARRPFKPLRRPTGQEFEKFLGELELAVMEVVWQREPVTVRDVLTALQGERPLAYTTFMTVMNRLTEKDWLTVETRGRAYLYRAARSRQEAEAEAIGGVIRTLIQDFGEVTVAQFVKELDMIDPDQLSRLAQLAQEASQNRE